MAKICWLAIFRLEKLKITLALILCSYVANSCLTPYPYPQQFDSLYDCFIEGYKQSIIKMEDIGRDDVNNSELYIKFICYDQEIKVEEET